MYAEMNVIVNRLRTEPPCSVYFRSEIPLADVLKSLGPLVFWGDDYDKEFLRSVKSEDDKDLPEDYKTSFRLCDPLLPDRFKKRMREIMLSRFMLPVMFVTCHCGFESFPEMELSRSAITAGEVVLGGRYRVLKFIGQSVFCRTVKAVDLESGRHVCVKIIKNQKPYFDQGLDEVKVLKHLSEAGELDIVLGSQFVYKMLDYFYFREHLMIVTELMECDLYVKNKTWMHKRGISFFTLERVRRLAIQVLMGLKFMHALQIMHTDLKPENIMLEIAPERVETGLPGTKGEGDMDKKDTPLADVEDEVVNAKIIDVGSAVYKSDPVFVYTQSRAYRAPEVVLACPYDEKIDIWSVGCILAEVFTGRVLFPCVSRSTLLASILAVCGGPTHTIPGSLCNQSRLMSSMLCYGRLFEVRGAVSRDTQVRPAADTTTAASPCPINATFVPVTAPSPATKMADGE